MLRIPLLEKFELRPVKAVGIHDIEAHGGIAEGVPVRRHAVDALGLDGINAE